MPAALFPRTVLPSSVTPLADPTGLVSVGHTGKAQLRGIVAMGRTWQETWSALRAGDTDVEGFLAWVAWAYNTSQIFTIKHLTTPGSGRPPNGLSPTSFPLVNGAGQTGDSLAVDGVAPSVANSIRAGDVVRVGGVSPLLKVTEDASSNGSGQLTLKINPPIPVGSSPADNTIIIREDNVMNAYIATAPNFPDADPSRLFAGFSLTFRETP